MQHVGGLIYKPRLLLLQSTWCTSLPMMKIFAVYRRDLRYWRCVPSSRYTSIPCCQSMRMYQVACRLCHNKSAASHNHSRPSKAPPTGLYIRMQLQSSLRKLPFSPTLPDADAHVDCSKLRGQTRVQGLDGDPATVQDGVQVHSRMHVRLWRHELSGSFSRLDERETGHREGGGGLFHSTSSDNDHVRRFNFLEDCDMANVTTVEVQHLFWRVRDVDF